MTSSTSSLAVKMAEAVAIKEPNGYKQMLEQAVQEHESEVSACREVAIRLFNAESYRLALDFQVRAVNGRLPSGQRNANDENLLALLLIQIGDLPSARTVLERMASEWPSNAGILMNLALVQKNLGDLAEGGRICRTGTSVGRQQCQSA